MDLGQLYQLRLANDSPVDGGFSYAGLGSNNFVDAWVNFGVTSGMLTHHWRDQLDRYSDMGRSEANRILMDALQGTDRN